MEEIFKRSIDLIGRDNFNIIKNLKICVIGLGGVGGTALMSLVRSGVLNFLLIDFDNVCLSNLNRQLFYDINDLNKSKVEVCLNKLKLLSPNCKCVGINTTINENFDFGILNEYDFVVDAIDDIKAKKILIKHCLNNKINFISSLGMGNRLSPENIKIVSLNKTFNDPLARKLRYELKKEGLDTSKVKVCFSSSNYEKREEGVSSMIFAPSTAGLLIGYYVVNFFIEKYNNH